MGMIEARLRVATKNQLRVNLSPQDIVSCSTYSQGCEGGFPYLIAGKYSQDHGAVLEECNPYTGKDSACPIASEMDGKKCPRTYVVFITTISSPTVFSYSNFGLNCEG